MCSGYFYELFIASGGVGIKKTCCIDKYVKLRNEKLIKCGALHYEI